MVITDCSIKNGVSGVSINSSIITKQIFNYSDKYGFSEEIFNCLSYTFLTSLCSNNIRTSKNIVNRSIT